YRNLGVRGRGHGVLLHERSATHSPLGVIPWAIAPSKASLFRVGSVSPGARMYNRLRPGSRSPLCLFLADDNQCFYRKTVSRQAGFRQSLPLVILMEGNFPAGVGACDLH